MIGLSRIAKRYAKAIFSIIVGNEERLKQVSQQVEVLECVLADKGVARFFSSPVIPKKLKREVMEEILSKSGIKSQEFNKFLQELIDSGRIVLLKDILVSFKSLVLESRGLIPASLTSAYPLSEEEKTRVDQCVKKLTGLSPVFTVVQDKKLLGGFVLQIGNTLLDMSLLGRLREIEAKSLA